MSIEQVVKRSRLWSCDSHDTKPEGWAPGIFMVELDTGDMYFTDTQRRWVLCFSARFAQAVHPHIDVTQIPHIHALLPGSLGALQDGGLRTGQPSRGGDDAP